MRSSLLTAALAASAFLFFLAPCRARADFWYEDERRSWFYSVPANTSRYIAPAYTGYYPSYGTPIYGSYYPVTNSYYVAPPAGNSYRGYNAAPATSYYAAPSYSYTPAYAYPVYVLPPCR